MSSNYTNDDIRSVYNTWERGSLDPKRSFLCALACTSLISDDEGVTRIINENTDKLFVDEHIIQNKINICDSDEEPLYSSHDFHKILEQLPIYGKQDSCSFSKYIELADDLYLATTQAAKAAQPTNIPQQNSATTLVRQESREAKEKYHVMENVQANKATSSKRNISEAVDEEDPSNAKKNAFSSAKDRFQQEGGKLDKNQRKAENKGISSKASNSDSSNDDSLPPELAHCDKALVEKIEADIIHHGQAITFEDIAGLDFAKECVIELICWPMKQPQLFQGLRSLPRGVLLFGPPGTGKTLIGKAIAHQSGATFFSISASSLMSKWIGEGEKTVRTLFAVAAYRQPSVVFIDEVDSPLCQRSSDENEATRRIKTEFMVQLDGANTNLDARVVIIGATNRPEELDEAVRRRFVKRLYIPLPDEVSRRALLQTLLLDVYHKIDQMGLETLTQRTEGYSGADIRSLCTEAAMGPIRELAQSRRGDLKNIRTSDVPPITLRHFDAAFDTVTPSVSPNDLQRYIEWDTTYGSYRRMY